MNWIKRHLKKILTALGLTIAVALAAPNDPQITLRQPTGGQIAFAVWQMPDGTPVTVKVPQADYDDFALVNKGVGELKGKPDPDAVFMIAGGGYPELDTADGYPHAGDAWEQDGELVIATSDNFDFEYSSKIATDPGNGQTSEVKGIKAASVDNRVVIKNHDLEKLPAFDSLPTAQSSIELVDVVEPNHHSVTYDASGSGTTNGGSSVTYAHTVTTSADRYIAVMAAVRVATISTITYAGSDLTVRASSSADANGWTSHYYDRVAPSSGTNNVVITMSGAANVDAGSTSAYGVDQTTPRTDVQGANGLSTSPTITVNSAVGELVISEIKATNSNSLTLDSSFTQDWSNAFATGIGAHKDGASPTVTRTDSVLSSAWTATAASLKAATAASNPPPRAILNGKMIIGAPIVVTDNFNRADGGLGADWATAFNLGAPAIASNQAQVSALGDDEGAYYSTVAFPPDQYAQFKVITLNTSTGRNAYAVVRQSTATDTQYEFRVRGPFGGSTAWGINKTVSGSVTALTNGTMTLASGDTIRLEAIGSILIASVNGTVISTTTDTSITSGQPGFQVRVAAGAVTDVQIDDFEAGALGYGKLIIP